MTVLWDGTADRPWGKHLFAPQHQIIPPPADPLPHYSSFYREITSKVRATKGHFGEEAFNAEQLARAAGIHPDRAASVIGHFVRVGMMIRLPKQPMRKREYQWLQK